MHAARSETTVLRPPPARRAIAAGSTSRAGSAWRLATAALLCAAAARAQSTERVSVASGGAQGNAASGPGLNCLSISADGRYVAFESDATNLASGDTNGVRDVFVRDRIAGTTERVSVGAGGLEGDGASAAPSISADGRYVAFESHATNLVALDTNGERDIFVRDRLAGTTERVSVATSGVEGDLGSAAAAISADGRHVSYESDATNLVAGDTNSRTDVFVRDVQAGTTVRVSTSAQGMQGTQGNDEPAISGDGRYVAFDCWASDLYPGDTNGCEDLVVKDLVLGTLERLSVSAAGVECNANTGQPKISADGRYVVFFSDADNLVAPDTNGAGDVFVRDLVAGTIERVSVAAGGVEGDQGSIYAAISDDGRWVSFMSVSSNLVANDVNAAADAFVKDRATGAVELASVSTAGTRGDADSLTTRISADGRFVAFVSFATNLVPGDTNGACDVFVRDRDASGFEVACVPGQAGTIACPCSNPPTSAGAGCDNSAATGGASLSASGAARLSSDTLVLATSGETPTATSIVLQGSASLASGVVFGQGVRCAGGTLLRLYVEAATAGGISEPDAGDPSVSARSAALGDAIQAGERRWYLVYYRDPAVLGGCPPTSTFNATQTGRVTWSP